MPQGPQFENDTKFRKFLKSFLQFSIYEVDVDNDSLYKVLAYILLWDVSLGAEVRREITVELEEQEGIYRGMFSNYYDAALNGVKDGAAPLGIVELTAATAAYEFNIVVYQRNGVYLLLPAHAPYSDTFSISIHDNGQINALIPIDMPKETCRKLTEMPSYHDKEFCGLVKVVC